MPTLISPTSLGDTVIVCALAKAFKEQHKLDKLDILVPDTHIPIVNMYRSHFDEVRHGNRLDVLAYCHSVAKRDFSLVREIVAHPWWHGDSRWEDFMDRPNPIGLDDIYRHILHLPRKTKFELPTTNPALALDIPEDSIVILPDNNSIPQFNDEFWRSLISQIIHPSVYINMAGNLHGKRTDMLGAIPIELTVENCIPTANRAKTIISGNNGMACMLNMAQVKAKQIMLIYDKPFMLNGRQINYPIEYQSFEYTNYGPMRPRDICLNPDMIGQADIDRILGAL